MYVVIQKSKNLNYNDKIFKKKNYFISIGNYVRIIFSKTIDFEIVSANDKNITQYVIKSINLFFIFYAIFPINSQIYDPEISRQSRIESNVIENYQLRKLIPYL
jgi:hypothetical protein